MIDRILVHPKVIRKYKESPIGNYIDPFVGLLIGRGYSRSDIRIRIGVVCDLGRWLKKKKLDLSEFDPNLVEKFLRYRRKKVTAGVFKGNEFTLRLFTSQLRNARIIPDLPKLKTILSSTDQAINYYEPYLKNERALCRSTIHTYTELVRRFLDHRFGKGEIQYRKICAKDIYQFVLKFSGLFSPGRSKLLVSALRSYFRFLFLKKKIVVDLSLCIPTIPDRRRSHIPKYIPASEVNRIVNSCDRATVIGRRDHAILLILARLGLRACEVWRLTLDDFDWEKGEVIIRGKGAKFNRFPIPNEVGKAIVAYLKRGRPNSTSRHIFMGTRPPFPAITNSSSIDTVVRKAIERAGLNPPNKGAHLLRHSMATHLLRQGASLKEVGEILRHKQINTTEIYAKVDLSRLSELTQGWPKVSLIGAVS